MNALGGLSLWLLAFAAALFVALLVAVVAGRPLFVVELVAAFFAPGALCELLYGRRKVPAAAVLASVALVVLVAVGLSGCGADPPPAREGGCSVWEEGSPCACDGGLPGVEVCARTDAGNLRVCRCR